VLAFAGVRDVVGASELDMPLPQAATAGSVLDWLIAEHPALADYRACVRLAVNGAYVDATDRVCAGDEVAIIPPVAGG
jgi:molybdopterin converting factor subunit 1